MGRSVRAGLSGRHHASCAHSSAPGPGKRFTKKFVNAEAAHVTFLSGFDFLPPYVVLLGASVLVGLIQGGGRKKILRPSLLFTVAEIQSFLPFLAQESGCVRLVQGTACPSFSRKNPDGMLCNCLICI